MKSKSELETHQCVHKGKKRHTCQSCGRIFSYLSGLKQNSRTHTGEKPYSCKTCGKGFHFSQALKVHMRKHTGERPHCCSTCGRSHTGEKTYRCNICGMLFTTKCHLNRHIQNDMIKKRIKTWCRFNSLDKLHQKNMAVCPNSLLV